MRAGLASLLAATAVAVEVGPARTLHPNAEPSLADPVVPVQLPKPDGTLFGRAVSGSQEAHTAAAATKHAHVFALADVSSLAALASMPITASIPVAAAPGAAKVALSMPSATVAASMPSVTLEPSSLPYDLSWDDSPAENRLKKSLGLLSPPSPPPAGTSSLPTAGLSSLPTVGLSSMPVAAAAAVNAGPAPAPTATAAMYESHGVSLTRQSVSDAAGHLNAHNVANRHLFVNTSGATIVVSHHKSGTVASQDLIVSLCCPSAQHTTPSNRFYTLFATPKSGCAYAACAKQNVDYARDGLRSTEPPAADSTTVHFVRDPASMVVSGYLYHRACNEPSWTRMHFSTADPPDWVDLRFGSMTSFAKVLESVGHSMHSWAASNATYCEVLQSAPVAQGLRAEAIRSLNAADGVGTMLRDRLVLSRYEGTLLEVCPPDPNPRPPNPRPPNPRPLELGAETRRAESGSVRLPRAARTRHCVAERCRPDAPPSQVCLDDVTPGHALYENTWEAISSIAGVRKLLHTPEWYTEHSSTTEQLGVDDARSTMVKAANGLLMEILPAPLAAVQPCTDESHQASSGAASPTKSHAAAHPAASTVASGRSLTLPAGPPPRILGAVSHACGLSKDKQERVVKGLSQRCATTPSLSLIVNVFDAPLADADQSDYASQAALVRASSFADVCPSATSTPLPSCVLGVTRVHGFKMLFFKHVLTAATTAPYDFIWTVDNDLDLTARWQFNLIGAVRQMAATRVAIAQPVVKFESRLKRATSARAAHGALKGSVSLMGEDFVALGTNLPRGCAVQQVAWIESQTPIFAAEAWRLLHSKMLSHLSEEVYLGSDQGPSTFWCNMMALELPDRPACAVLNHTIADTSLKTIRDVQHLSKAHDVIDYMKTTFPRYTDICQSKTSKECVGALHLQPRGDCLLSAS